MEVRCKIDGSGENALAVLAFGFPEKLFPPFAEIGEFRIEGHEQLYLISFGIQEVPHRRIFQCGIVFRGFRAYFLGLGGSGEQLPCIIACKHYRKQPDGSQHGKTSPHVVFYDESPVALRVRHFFQSPFGLVRYGDYPAACRLFSITVFYEVLHQAESHGRLGGRARLGNDDSSHGTLQHEVEKFRQIILGKVVPRKHYIQTVFPASHTRLERMRQGFNGAFCPEVRTSYAYDHDSVHPGLQPLGLDVFELPDKGIGSLRREMFPSEKIVPRTGLLVQYVVSLEGFSLVKFIIAFIHERHASVQIDSYHNMRF